MPKKKETLKELTAKEYNKLSKKQQRAYFEKYRKKEFETVIPGTKEEYKKDVKRVKKKKILSNFPSKMFDFRVRNAAMRERKRKKNKGGV